MKFSSIPSAFIVLAASLFVSVNGATLDVFVPPITYPHAGTVWTVGQRHNVTWNASNPPKQITNPTGTILLRKGGLTTSTTLASGFSILLGRIEVTVPNVATGSDYQLVLFGDSGNFSPDFTIQQ